MPETACFIFVEFDKMESQMFDEINLFLREVLAMSKLYLLLLLSLMLILSIQHMLMMESILIFFSLP
jgi:hypothetical protein